jgi:hypothetical protein
VPAWSPWSYAFSPLVAIATVGLLTLLLRWAFGHGHSLIERPIRPGATGEYGVLVDVASPPTFVEAELLRRSLADAGVRATLADTRDGPRVLVFPADAATAREVLRTRGRPA